MSAIAYDPTTYGYYPNLHIIEAYNRFITQLTGTESVVSGDDILAMERDGAHFIFLVFEDDPKEVVLGMAVIYSRRTRSGVVCYVEDFVVDQMNESREIVRDLFDRCVDHAKAVGANCLRLTYPPTGLLSIVLDQAFGFGHRRPRRNLFELDLLLKEV
jgi:hypothetical protein